MAQVYSFTDQNGETRLFAEIHPDPTGTPFNGGTITNPLTVAITDQSGSSIPVTVKGVGDPADFDVAFTVTDSTNVTVLQVDSAFMTLSGHLVVVAGPSYPALDVQTNAQVSVLQVDSAGHIGFFNHATTAQQTGVAVSAAAIHAALVNLGLITA